MTPELREKIVMEKKPRMLIWIAWRHLVAGRRKQGLSFMTMISIAGVALGVAALVVVLSVMAGFEQDLKEKMLRGLPHVEILAENAIAGFSLVEYPIKKFQKKFPEAQGMSVFTQSDVVLKQGKHMATVVLFGVDPLSSTEVWGFGGSMIDGSLEDVNKEHRPVLSSLNDNTEWPGIILGDGLAVQLGADVGDEIVAFNPQAATSSSMITGGTLTRHYVVVGVFQTGLFNYDSKWAVVSLSEGRKFMVDYDPSLDLEKYVTGVAFNVPNPYEVGFYEEEIKKTAGLTTLTWKDANSALLFALKLEKFTMGSILMLIVLVAAFSISGTMMMTVFHRKSQVCLLRSLGMTQADVGRIFMIQGLVIGGIGIMIGMVFGLSLCYLLDHFHFVHLPPGIGNLRAWPVKFLPFDYVVIGIFAWILSLAGATYPALTAAKQNPSSGLRY